MTTDSTIETCMTEAGLSILAQSQLGKTVTFTRVKIGDGELGDTDATTLTDLINPLQELEIYSKEIIDNTTISITALITQTDTGFYFREIGLFAIDPDTEEEVLYAYGNKGDNAVYIPSNTSSVSVEEEATILVTVGNSANVEVIYSPDYSIYAKTDLSNLTDEAIDYIRACTDGLYTPVDLTAKFADEISNNYDGDEWAWIQARIQAANFTGIHIGDYIPVTLTGGTIGSGSEVTITENQQHYMQVAGIDTYYNSGDTAIPHHIDFISMNTIGAYCTFNGGASNNGTSSQPNPWLASRIYAVLNGVNNYTTSAYNSLAHGLNCSSGGILQMLPEECQNVLITKRTWAEEQYSSSALINYPSGYGWKDYGKLWVPHEVEICGYQPNSYNRNKDGGNIDNLTRGLNKMYPIFRQQTRVKLSADDNSTRQSYWLCCPSGTAATNVCNVPAAGYVNNANTTNTGISVCFGFRIG